MKINHFFSSCAVISSLLTLPALASDLGSVDSQFTAVQISRAAWLDTINDFMLEFSSQGVGEKEYKTSTRMVCEFKSQQEFADLLSSLSLLDRIQDLYFQNGSSISLANLMADRNLAQGLLESGLVALKQKMFSEIFELELGLIKEKSTGHKFELELNPDSFNKVLRVNGLSAVLSRIISTYSQDLVTSEILGKLTEANVLLSDATIERLFDNLAKAYFIHNAAATNRIAIPLAQLMTDDDEDLNAQLDMQLTLRNRTIQAFLREKADARFKTKTNLSFEPAQVTLADTPIDTAVLDQLLPEENSNARNVPALIRDAIETAGSVSEADDHRDTTEEDTAGKKSDSEAAAPTSTDEKATSPRKPKLPKIKDLFKRKSKQISTGDADK